MTSKTQHKMSSAGADHDPPTSGLRPIEHVIAAVALFALLCAAAWVLYALWTGVSTGSSWSIETPHHTVEATSPRVETSVVAFVGSGEDHYGVTAPGGGYQRLRLARHCDGEWSITHPLTTTALPPPGTPVVAQITSEGRRSADAAGTVAANGITVSLAPSAELDEALFVDAAVTVRVKAGERRLSLAEPRLQSYRPRLGPTGWTNPASFVRGDPFDPLERLKAACR